MQLFVNDELIQITTPIPADRIGSHKTEELKTYSFNVRTVNGDISCTVLNFLH